MNNYENVVEGLREMQEIAHRNACDHGFYDAIYTTTDHLQKDGKIEMKDVVKRDFVLAQIAKICSEAGEAVHAIQHDAAREDLAEELADIMIRTVDLASYLGIDIGKDVAKKMFINANRPRLHGKTC